MKSFTLKKCVYLQLYFLHSEEKDWTSKQERVDRKYLSFEERRKATRRSSKHLNWLIQTLSRLQVFSISSVRQESKKWILDDFIYLLTRLIETLMMVTKTFFDIDRAVYSEINDSEKNIGIRNITFEYDYAQAWQEQ